MAKSRDDRVKALKDGVTWNLPNQWDSCTSKYTKELSAPNFRAKGSMPALTKEFDTAQTKFT